MEVVIVYYSIHKPYKIVLAVSAFYHCDMQLSYSLDFLKDNYLRG